MECLIQNRVYALQPWLEKRVARAKARLDIPAAFREIRLMERIDLLQSDPAYDSREVAVDRCRRLLQSN
jgi:hypothetical protein